MDRGVPGRILGHESSGFRPHRRRCRRADVELRRLHHHVRHHARRRQQEGRLHPRPAAQGCRPRAKATVARGPLIRQPTAHLQRRNRSYVDLSGFSDEISPEFEEQCSLVSSLGLKYLEFRSAWDVNILDLDDAQLAKAKDILSAHGLGVSSIGSPIGKIFINEDFEPHFGANAARCRRCPLLRRALCPHFLLFIPADPIRTATVTRC